MCESTEHRLAELRSLRHHRCISESQYKDMVAFVLHKEEERIRHELKEGYKDEIRDNIRKFGVA